MLAVAKMEQRTGRKEEVEELELGLEMGSEDKDRAGEEEHRSAR